MELSGQSRKGTKRRDIFVLESKKTRGLLYGVHDRIEATQGKDSAEVREVFYCQQVNGTLHFFFLIVVLHEPTLR